MSDDEKIDPILIDAIPVHGAHAKPSIKCPNCSFEIRTGEPIFYSCQREGCPLQPKVTL